MLVKSFTALFALFGASTLLLSLDVLAGPPSSSLTKRKIVPLAQRSPKRHSPNANADPICEKVPYKNWGIILHPLKETCIEPGQSFEIKWDIVETNNAQGTPKGDVFAPFIQSLNANGSTWVGTALEPPKGAVAVPVCAMTGHVTGLMPTEYSYRYLNNDRPYQVALILFKDKYNHLKDGEKWQYDPFVQVPADYGHGFKFKLSC